MRDVVKAKATPLTKERLYSLFWHRVVQPLRSAEGEDIQVLFDNLALMVQAARYLELAEKVSLPQPGADFVFMERS